jgi:muramoyltetrapeptide carboxypeptidase LdcA involved in peptidoglycan recycling
MTASHLPFETQRTALARPPVLRPGSHIRIVSPAFPSMAYAPHRMERARDALAGRGFSVSFGKNALEVAQDGMSAGTPEERAADLMDAFTDPAVDAVIAADAGVGTREVLPLLDAEAIAANRKPFIGYCDNVFLNQFLLARAGLISYYGCTFMEHFGEAAGPYPETLRQFEQTVMAEGPLACVPFESRTRDWSSWYVAQSDRTPRERADRDGWTWIRGAVAEGRVLGGELSTLPDLVRFHGLTATSAILFWDVAPTNDKPLVPQLRQLSDTCDLGQLSAMLVGTNSKLAGAAWTQAVRAALEETMPGADFPVVVNADLGHLSPNWLIPYGELARLTPDEGLCFRRGERI